MIHKERFNDKVNEISTFHEVLVVYMLQTSPLRAKLEK